jgi:hypothetical protein
MGLGVDAADSGGPLAGCVMSLTKTKVPKAECRGPVAARSLITS